MGNSLRCCLACVLPCGALDLIRIVHLNGYVEEITRAVTAEEVLKSYPNHVLSKPCSSGNNMVRKILILSPDSELKRGGIYFLIPDSSLPSNKSSHKSISSKKVVKPRKNVDGGHRSTSSSSSNNNDNVVVVDKNVQVQQQQQQRVAVDCNVVDDDDKKYVSLDLSLDELCNTLDHHQNVEVIESKPKSKSKSSGRHQRRRSSRGRSGVWQPHLQSITEDL